MRRARDRVRGVPITDALKLSLYACRRAQVGWYTLPVQAQRTGDDIEPLGSADIVLVALAGLAATSAVALQLLVVPRFAAMFAEFGAVLPAVTRIALSGWPMLGAALLIAALGGLGLRLRVIGRREPGLALLIAAPALGLLADALCVYALYAPIFELAGKIRP